MANIFGGISKLMQESTGMPAASPTPDPMAAAVTTAMQQYPWLRKMGVPIKLTQGKGPFMSESWDPDSEENPHRGSFTVEMRNPGMIADKAQWPSILGREGMDWMGRHDPVFQQTRTQCRQMMTPEQLASAKARYEKTPGEQRSFEDFLKGAWLQDAIGGYIFDMPGWKKFPFTPQQKAVLDKQKDYMWQGQKPVPLNVY